MTGRCSLEPGSVHVPTPPTRNPVTRRRLLRDGVTLAVLLALLRLLDPTVTARTLLLTALIWTAGWAFWAWWDYRAWRGGR